MHVKLNINKILRYLFQKMISMYKIDEEQIMVINSKSTKN